MILMSAKGILVCRVSVSDQLVKHNTFLWLWPAMFHLAEINALV